MADIYPVRVPGLSLVMMPRPRAGDWLEDEVHAWKAASIELVVSLLEPHEIDELELQAEPSVCASHGIEFRSFPIPDRGVPRSYAGLDGLVASLLPKVTTGHTVAVHCRAGIGRSGLVAAAILVRAGVPPEEVFSLLSNARGLAVPDTSQQADWLKQYARSAI
jgi:protein-tyrosine phosphatase